jgi:hypothetical protein
MAMVDPWPSVRQAVIRQLRSNLVLKDQLPGDWSNGVAPADTPFPRGVIQLHYGPVERDWTGFTALLGFDIVVFAEDQGVAASLTQLVFTSLNNTGLDVAGQTSLSCLFVSTFDVTEPAPEGTDTVFAPGAIYAVRTAQSNPVNRTLSVTLTSTIG